MCPQLVFLLQHTQEGAAKRKKNRVDGQRLVQYDRGQRRKWGRLKLESLGGLQKTVKKYCLSSWKGFSHPLVQVYCRTASHPVSSWHLIICQSRLAAGGVLVPNALQVESGRAASSHNRHRQSHLALLSPYQDISAFRISAGETQPWSRIAANPGMLV